MISVVCLIWNTEMVVLSEFLLSDDLLYLQPCMWVTGLDFCFVLIYLVSSRNIDKVFNLDLFSIALLYQTHRDGSRSLENVISLSY